jgi:hypothetical protein
MHSRLTKPKVSEVKAWIYASDLGNKIVEIYYADIDDAFIKAIPLVKGYRTKYFYGETAWSDSQMYARDIYTEVMHMS